MAGQAQTMEVPKKLPLFPSITSRNPNIYTGGAGTGAYLKDARLVNAYAEYDALNDDYIVHKRFGLSSPAFAPSVNGGLGLYRTSNSPGYYWPGNFKGRDYTVCGNGVAALYENGVVYGGLTAFDSFTQMSFCEIPPQTGDLNNTLLLNSSSFSGFYAYEPKLTLGAGTLTLINPAIFSTYATCKGMVYLDGTTYIMDGAGNIYGSPLNNIFGTWSALNVIQASLTADPGVYLARQLSYVVALKSASTQIFYDAGAPLPNSPLAPVQGAYIPYGCKSADSVQTLDTMLFWMTGNVTISPQIIMMENLAVKIVSTPALDRLLSGFIGGPVYSWTLKHGGHRLYGLTVTDINMTLVFDVDQNLWYIWTNSIGNYWQVVSVSYTGTPGVSADIYAQHTNGSVYVLDEDYVYPSDNGVLFPVDIYTPNFDGGADRKKTLSMMRIHADKVPGSYLDIRHSEDVYQSYSQFRRVDLNLKRPYLDNCGTFNRRAWHFRHMAPTPFRISGVSLQMDLGTL